MKLLQNKFYNYLILTKQPVIVNDEKSKEINSRFLQTLTMTILIVSYSISELVN